jgi:hypothetical protein
MIQVPAQVLQPLQQSGLLLIAATSAQVFGLQVPCLLHPVQDGQLASDSEEQATVGQFP